MSETHDPHVMETEKARMSMSQAAYKAMLEKVGIPLDSKGRLQGTNDTIMCIDHAPYTYPYQEGDNRWIYVMVRLRYPSFQGQDHTFFVVTLGQEYTCTTSEITAPEAYAISSHYKEQQDDEFEQKYGWRPYRRPMLWQPELLQEGGEHA
jgi:hypothetical protein